MYMKAVEEHAEQKEIDWERDIPWFHARYPELPFCDFCIWTRVERSLFYPAVEPIGTNGSYIPIPW
jgi:hypothetical protein